MFPSGWNGQICHPSGENLAGFSWSSILSCMGRVLKTQVVENADSHCRTERGTDVWCALPLGQLCSFSVQVMAAKWDIGEITEPICLLLPWMMVFLSHSSYYLTVKQVCSGSNLIKASSHFLCDWNIRVQAFACCTAELLLWDFGAGLAQLTMTSPSVISIVALVYLQLWRSAFCTCAWVIFKVQDVAKTLLKWSSQKHNKQLVLFCFLACHSEMSLHRRRARTRITTSAWMLFCLALSFLAHWLFILSLGSM